MLDYARLNRLVTQGSLEGVGKEEVFDLLTILTSRMNYHITEVETLRGLGTTEEEGSPDGSADPGSSGITVFDVRDWHTERLIILSGMRDQLMELYPDSREEWEPTTPAVGAA